MLIYFQSLLLIALEVLCCKIFFETFSEKRISKCNWKNNGVIIGLILSAYLIAMIVKNVFALKQVIIITITALFMFLYFKISFLKSVILSALFQGLLLFIDYVTLMLYVSIFNSISEIGESYIEGSLLIVLGKVLLFTAVLVIRKCTGKNSSASLSDSEWLRFIYFPVFTICTIIAILTTTENIQSQKQEDMFYVIALSLAVMNIVVFYLIHDILKREAEIHESKIYQLQVKNQTSMYHTISENYDKLRKKTHEYKNQILCIQSLLSKKKYNELEQYVNNISCHITKDLNTINTNNVIVDAILNSKYQEMLDSVK